MLWELGERSREEEQKGFGDSLGVDNQYCSMVVQGSWSRGSGRRKNKMKASATARSGKASFFIGFFMVCQDQQEGVTPRKKKLH